MASSEQQVVEFVVTDIDEFLNEIGREVFVRTVKGWKMSHVALTFERPVVVEVATRHLPESPRGQQEQ
jgi:hypothetical protein